MSTEPSTSNFVRWIWARVHPCPVCKANAWKETGRKGRKQYRACTQCGHTFFVLPCAREWLPDPSGASVISEA
jgi:hypothetical protein